MAESGLVQRRETPAGPIAIVWPIDVAEAHCHSSGGVIIVGTDRCTAHAAAELSCVFEWRTPGECRHPGIDLADESAPRCLTCGVSGTVDTERWLKIVSPPLVEVEYGDDVVLLGAPDDHSATLTPDAS